jgi:hypothetical protein
MSYIDRFLQATERIHEFEPVDPWLGHGIGGLDTNLYRTVRELCERIKELEELVKKGYTDV